MSTAKMKFMLIMVFDWIDDKVLRHRWYYICQKVGLSTWWGVDNDPVQVKNEWCGVPLDEYNNRKKDKI